MNFLLYVVLEAVLLILVGVAIYVAFGEATREDSGGKSDDEPS
jgi:hypothetical protein